MLFKRNSLFLDTVHGRFTSIHKQIRVITLISCSENPNFTASFQAFRLSFFTWHCSQMNHADYDTLGLSEQPGKLVHFLAFPGKVIKPYSQSVTTDRWSEHLPQSAFTSDLSGSMKPQTFSANQRAPK